MSEVAEGATASSSSTSSTSSNSSEPSALTPPSTSSNTSNSSSTMSQLSPVASPRSSSVSISSSASSSSPSPSPSPSSKYKIQISEKALKLLGVFDDQNNIRGLGTKNKASNFFGMAPTKQELARMQLLAIQRFRQEATITLEEFQSLRAECQVR